MYNLDVNLASTAAAASALNGLLGVETGGATPRTPEIVNHLMAMTNPLDNYNFGDDAPQPAAATPVLTNSKMFSATSSDSNGSSSCNSQLESPTNGPNSVQQTCSQLIKAGLKLTIEQKRKHHSDSDDILDLDKCKRMRKIECSESEEDKVNNTGLTAEDEERRRRRRERNKIAATKCRLKKRERTNNLVIESETLEKANVELKEQIKALKAEQLNLSSMLHSHRPGCDKNIKPATREALHTHPLPSLSAMSASHSYGRAGQADGGYHRSQDLEMFRQEFSYPRLYQKGSATTTTTPTIVVDSPTDCYQSQLTNLDVVTSQNGYHHNYNTQQCHNYTTAQGYGNAGCLA